MRRKSLKLNYIYNISYQILIVLTPFITTPYISRILGADGIGEYSYANSIVSYFILFAGLGTGTFGKREISYSQDNIIQRSIVFWETEFLSLVSVGLCSCIYILYLFLTQKNIIYYILILSLISVAVDITWLFQGLEEFGKIVVRNFIIKILNICFIFIFVKSKADLNIYVFGLVFFTVLGNLSLWLYLPKYVRLVNIKSIHITKNIKEVLILFVPTIAVQIYTVVDKTMIGALTKESFENGYYEQAEKVTKIAMCVVQSVATVMSPRIGNLFQRGKKDEIKRYMYRSYSFVWMISIAVSFGIIGISANMVPWFFGSGYEKVVILLSILGFLAIAIGISYVTGLQYLIPTKQQNLFNKTVFTGAAVNIVLNSFLIPLFFSVGAAIASVAAETVIAITQLVFIRKEISIKTVLKLSKKYIFAGLLMLGLLKIENKFLPTTFIGTMIMIFTGAVLYFIMLIIIKDSFFMEILHTVTKRIKKFSRKQI